MEPIHVLVPGRGHDRLPTGELVLSESSAARAATSADYYKQHEAAFQERGGVIVYEGGWASAAGGVRHAPPPQWREGWLMRDYAVAQGVDAQYTVASIESTSTMDNYLQARRYLTGVSRLAIVTQLSHADRLVYCASKVLPGVTCEIIEAPGEDDPAILADEQRLLWQSRLLYGWARGPRALKLADRIGTMAGQLAGLNPAAKYVGT